MALEKQVNSYGQEQLIENFDKIIKIGDKFLQVRLIKTQRWAAKKEGRRDFTSPMPRAKFLNPQDEGFYYLVSRADVLEMQERRKNGS